VAGDCAASAKPWVLVATILASSIAYVDESVVNVALPAIETNLSASAPVIQWLINAYTLTLSSLLLVGCQWASGEWRRIGGRNRALKAQRRQTRTRFVRFRHALKLG
jgi:hypothetical protein